MRIINRQSGHPGRRSRASTINSTYTIDLLKGEGIPIRCRPGGIAFACLIAVVPFLVGVGATSFYLDSEIVIAIQNQQVSRLTTAVAGLADAVRQKERWRRKRPRQLTSCPM